MGLPTPPGAKPAAPTATPAPAPAPAPAAATAPKADGEKKQRKQVQFGPGRGDDKIKVPEVNSVNLNSLFESLKATIASTVGDSAAFVEAFEALNKGHFPGNKEGRAAYDAGRIVGIIHKRSKGPSARAATGGKVAKLQSLLSKLIGIAGDDTLAQLGISAEDLAGLTGQK